MADRYWYFTYAQERAGQVTYLGSALSKNEHPLVRVARWNLSRSVQDESDTAVLLSWREMTDADMAAMREAAVVAGLDPEFVGDPADRTVTLSRHG